ncbi:MAG: N-acetyltransferase [Novosphingobium sp.]|nr:N-acetyltransferase [Novosphingobium sp.]MBO9602197.1 N-acetyltransferase [Novosphingobium sp.]
MNDYVIRAERADDTVAIAALVALAFKGARHSDGSEPQIVERLRRAGALTVSLVAEEGWDILGHVAFSPVTIADGTEGWFGLGPVAVTPGRQREGIGAALVEAGLQRLHDNGASGCVVLGDPGYYQRFGFTHDARLAYPGPPADYFQCLKFDGPAPSGTVRYHPSFGG